MGRRGVGRASWSNLPDDLLMSIMVKLNPVDYSSFRGVCRGWRSAANDDADRVYTSSLAPLLLPRSPARAHNAVYSFIGKKFVYVKQRNMITRSDQGDTAGGQGNGAVGQPRRRLDQGDRVLGFSHGYLIARDKDDRTRLMLADALTGTVEDGIRFPPEDDPVLWVRTQRFLMTSPPASPDCLLVRLTGSSVLYCRPGGTWWKHHEFEREADGRRPWVGKHGAAAIGQKLYVLTWLDKYELLELELLQTGPRITKVEAEGMPPSPGLRPVLVECGGELLAVNARIFVWSDRRLDRRAKAYRMARRDRRSVAYRLDRRARKWVPVHDLGGRVIALEIGFVSASVSWRPTGSRRPARDRIYSYYHHDFAEPRDRVCLTRLRDGTMRQFDLPGDDGGGEGFQWIVPGLCASPTASYQLAS